MLGACPDKKNQVARVMGSIFLDNTTLRNRPIEKSMGLIAHYIKIAQGK